MAKDKKNTVFTCQKCGAQSLKWSGRCLECGSWGTLKEELANKSGQEFKPAADLSKLTPLSSLKPLSGARLATGVSEIDRVFGSGLMPGSLVLLAGEPGIGKSTLVAQICRLLSEKQKLSVVYASGEESGPQVKERFSRLSGDAGAIGFIGETDIDEIVAILEEAKPRLAVIDSIQTVKTAEAAGETGSISQIRAAAAKLLTVAKQHDIVIIIIGHITKDGQLAGPKSLEHIVDMVAYLETDSLHGFRLLRSTKNRFGSTNEIGIFDMTEKGFREIKNPSSVFLDSATEPISGSVISCVREGSRPFFVEVQALVTKTVFGYPQRKSSGFDLNRLQVLAAVLTKRTGINLTNQDIILNIVGGLKVNDPALDLAVALAIVSSLSNQALGRKLIALGEIGLGGEVRNVGQLEPRLAEAEKLGFTTAVVPTDKAKTKKINLKMLKNLNELPKLLGEL